MNIITRYTVVALLLGVLVACAPAVAQRLIISDLDTTGYPIVRAKVYLLDDSGDPIERLSARDLAVSENGGRREIISLTCPPAGEAVPISSVLTIDVSGSMSSPGASQSGVANIELARSAASAWVNALPEDGSECALSTFDDQGMINIDFTTDRSRLRDAIAALRPRGGTSYNAGLLTPPMGAIQIAARGRNRRVVIFLTDGLGGGSETSIVEAAKSTGTTIFCVTLGMPAPAVLRNIARRTGGDCFERVSTLDEAASIYRAILRRAQGGEPCEVVWKSDPSCRTERTVSIALPARSIAAETRYVAPSGSMPKLEIEPPAALFGPAVAGRPRELRVTLAAVHQPVTVAAIEPVGRTTGPFELLDAPTPFTLAPGERRAVTVRFTPADTLYHFARWRITSDACSGGTIFASAGTGGACRSRASGWCDRTAANASTPEN